MKISPAAQAAATPTLQSVLDRLASDPALSGSRGRDLRSAVTSFAKLRAQPPSAIPLDLADIRRTLDSFVPAQANVSPKRMANLRSGLAAAIDASGLRPMLKTATSKSTRYGLDFSHLPTSRFGMVFRASPGGQVCGGSGQRLSTIARSTASSPIWMERPWSENSATFPGPSPSHGTPW